MRTGMREAKDGKSVVKYREGIRALQSMMMSCVREEEYDQGVV